MRFHLIHAVILSLVGFALPARAQEPRAGHHKIGVIGAGHVGSTLGRLWLKAGDEVLFASRHPDTLKDLAADAGPRAHVGTVAQAAAFGDVVVIAVPYSALPDIAKDNAASLNGKVVFDASNAIADRDGPLVEDVRKVGIGVFDSKLMPTVHLVRGFNAINYKNMQSDAFRTGDRVGIPLAGDDPTAIAVGSELVRQAGFEPIVVPLSRADDFGPGRPLGVGAFSTADWKRKLGDVK